MEIGDSKLIEKWFVHKKDSKASAFYSSFYFGNTATINKPRNVKLGK